ncbi:uncharacterized protein LOC128991935 [Macrosteles quadrilineatus]|uniref:uncharacterized protein LOC128991935 n=1 Tax=Macrosteles quadrilineatus TaxID=74068 RepID=UPI0023E32E7B|nr:uncharacterized protein LOC128991935 [Macrosteles quadrilineatus]
MGHGTGAACVSYLMISPLAQAEGNRGGLFKRAILMSGTALSDWALTSNPVQATIQVAQALNCPDSQDAMASCLRRKRLHELTSVTVHVPPFKTRFGPVVDGQVIPNDPSLIMSEYKNLFQQYDLMGGLTEMESYYLLNDVELVHGMIENEFYEKLDEYLNAKFEKQPELAKSKTIYYYRTWEKASSLSAAESHRNTLLEILSDARVAAPIVRTMDLHSDVNGKSYFYVFKHLTKYADLHPWIQQSVQGEELPYVFGVPLEPKSSHLDNNYSQQEKLLSEVVMTLWTNFAKTGSPNAPRKHNFQTQSHREWRQYDLEWPEYDAMNQRYYSIEIPPSIKQYYRQRQMVFWNHDLPITLNNSNFPYRPTPPPWLSPGVDQHDIHRPPQGTDTNHPPPPRTIYHAVTVIPPPEPPVDDPVTYKGPDQRPDDGSSHLNAMASSVTLSIVIFVGICFLLVNMCAFIGLYYQRDRLKVRERIVNTRYRCVNAGNEEEDAGDHYMKSDSNNRALESRDLKNIEIKSILKSSEGLYEQVKPESVKTASVGKGGRRIAISRQASSSTVTIDPHTKVKEWIAQEIVQRCSPRFLRKPKKSDFKSGSCDTYADQTDQMSNKTLDSNGSKLGSLMALQKKNVKKVSVAIDATPATRSASILQQTPIELTKSMDEGLVLSSLSPAPEKESMKPATSLITILKRPSLQRSDALNSDESVSEGKEPLRRSTSINLQLSTASDLPQITHFHSKSDPVTSSSIPKLFDIYLSPEKGPCDVLYSTVQKKRPPDPVGKPIRDINVTSRDDLQSTSELSAEEALDNIKRRNYPKVLPDYPDEEDFHLQKATKRRSLPLSAQISPDPGGTDDGSRDAQFALKVPPPPPPRVSTLGRKPSNTSPVAAFNSSQMTVKLKPTESNVPLALRHPSVPQLSSPIRPATNPTTHSQIKRVEPRVIIKPTMNPITSKKDTKGPSNIPRVTPPQPMTFGLKDTTTRPTTSTPAPSKIPEMGMGRKAKITPVKKTVSTETTDTSTSASNTGTIKRLNK